MDVAIPEGKIPFRHINVWSSFQGYKEVVKNAWSIPVEGCPMFEVVSKLKNVRSKLTSWNKPEVGDIHSIARKLCEQAEAPQRAQAQTPNRQELQIKLEEDRYAVEEAYAIEENFLRQNSRCMWLKEGDKNSKFFYTSLKIRRNRNAIKCIEADGQRLDNKISIENHISSFYKNLFN